MFSSAVLFFFLTSCINALVKLPSQGCQDSQLMTFKRFVSSKLSSEGSLCQFAAVIEYQIMPNLVLLLHFPACVVHLGRYSTTAVWF